MADRIDQGLDISLEAPLPFPVFLPVLHIAKES